MKPNLRESYLVFVTAAIIIFVSDAAKIVVPQKPFVNDEVSPNAAEIEPVTQRSKICRHVHSDGTPGLCEEQNVQKPAPIHPVENSTDTEVRDLTSPSPSSILSSTTAPPKSTASTTPVIDLPSVDKIIQPKEQMNPNSKFNMTTGGIAALVCFTVAVVFYAGIMMWKRVVMNAYQNREILLNEDDIGDINDEDMRHFEAACIQIEA